MEPIIKQDIPVELTLMSLQFAIHNYIEKFDCLPTELLVDATCGDRACEILSTYYRDMGSGYGSYSVNFNIKVPLTLIVIRGFPSNFWVLSSKCGLFYNPGA